MSASAERMFAAALIAVTIAAISAPAMAQWTVPISDPGSAAMFANWDRDATDYSPHWPHFGPLPPPQPNPPGPSGTIVIPEQRPKHYAPNVLILPRTTNPSRETENQTPRESIGN
jgi:hypothetical protein